MSLPRDEGIAPPPFDAIVLLSFGGPEAPADVMPFLENVTRGRGIPRARLEEVAARYHQFGGRSPINDQCRALVAALSAELERRELPLPVYWGNRNWKPFLRDTVATMARDGVRRAVAVATSAYSSYSSCRQYLEDIEYARAAAGAAAPLIEKIPPYWDHPGFLETMIEHTRAAVEANRAIAGAPFEPETTQVVFTAHSLPVPMAAGCDYEGELRQAASIVADAAAGGFPWDLAFQSRSGPPQSAWLEPDVVEHLRALRARGVRRVVLVPIGFVSDHMEVVYDLDVEARAAADAVGLVLTRAACSGSAPRFVAGLVDLVAAHIAGQPAASLARHGTKRAACEPGCCPPARPA